MAVTHFRANRMRKIAIVCMVFLGAFASHFVRADATRIEGVEQAGTPKEICHPHPGHGKNQYIVGYGSLLERASRQRTAPAAGEAVPVRVQGFRRAWIARGSSTGFSTTFLGVSTDARSRMNAVLFSLPDESAIAAMDSRENGYCRVKISAAQITTLDLSPLPDGERWIYVNKPQNTVPPSTTYPIVQSYVDVFLSGCLEVGRAFQLGDFAHECIVTTHGWSSHWVNDRIYPRRPFIYQPNAGAIDALLKRELPLRFRSIRIE